MQCSDNMVRRYTLFTSADKCRCVRRFIKRTRSRMFLLAPTTRRAPTTRLLECLARFGKLDSRSRYIYIFAIYFLVARNKYSGMPVQSDSYLLQNGQKIHFCNMGHVATFASSPTTYIAGYSTTEAVHAESHVHSADALCPVCGMTADGTHHTDVKGV